MLAARLGLHLQSTLRALTARGALTARPLPSLARQTLSPLLTARAYSYDRPSQPSSKIFVGNLPWSVEKSELLELFSPFGRVKECTLSILPSGLSRGYAHVQFETQEEAQAALEANRDEPMYLHERHVVIEYARDENQVVDCPPSRSIRIVGFYGRIAEVHQALGPLGDDILSFRQAASDQSPTGEHSGILFVNFRTIEQAQAALEMLQAKPTMEGGAFNVAFARRRRRPDNEDRGYTPRASAVRQMENRRNRRSVEEERYGDLQRYLDDRQYDDGDRPEDDRRARNSRMDDTGGRF